MDRVEHYLERILKNQGYWIRISKRKEHRASKKSKFEEREMVIEQIAIALTLMGIKYERHGTKFRIPLPPKPPKVEVLPTWKVLGVDYAHDHQ